MRLPACVLSFGLSATLVLSAQAPVPRALKDARTVFLVNDAGDQARFDDLASELRKWNRFTLADAEEEAELVLTFGRGATNTGAAVPFAGIWLTADEEAFSLVIRDRVAHTTLWSDKEAVGLSSKGTVKKLVKRLRERLGPLSREAPSRPQ